MPENIMTPEQKKWIDEASYESLLEKWRFASFGDPFFSKVSGAGDYYKKVMEEKKKAHEDPVSVSKRVG